jgi:hypothetical protein
MFGPMTKRFITFFAILIWSLGCKQRVENCGTDPNAIRLLEEGPFVAPGNDRELKISIQATDISDGKGRIFIHKSINRVGSTYMSTDHGRSWQSINMPECTQIPDLHSYASWTSCVMSRVNVDVCYRRKQDGGGDEFELSKDAGRTWTTVIPRYEDLKAVGYLRFENTGLHQQGRVYAELQSDGGAYSSVVSDDYGATFRKIDGRSFECRNSNRIFRVSAHPGPALLISNEDGKSWSELPGTEVIFERLYRNARQLDQWTTKRVSVNDEEGPLDLKFNVQQIECDPERSEVFYVLNRMKGIYRTKDNGKTFTVLPLGDKRCLDIGEIATDPIDPGIIYATLGRDKLYRSEDYGCSWDLLTIPGE